MSLISFINARLDSLEYSDLIRNSSKLVISGALSTVIGLITLPIITHLFTPQVFGQYNLIIAIITIGGAVASLRYDMAIVLPKWRKATYSVINLSILVLVINTALFSCIVFSLDDRWISSLGLSEISAHLWMIPIGILFLASQQLLFNIYSASSQFSGLAINKLFGNSAGQLGIIALGIISPFVVSIWLGYVTGIVISILISLYHLRGWFHRASLRNIRYAAIKYIKFPKYNTALVFFNNISIYLPIFLFSRNFSVEQVGLAAMAVKLLDAPISIVTSAISTVFYKKGADIYHRKPKELFLLYSNVLKKMAVIGLVFAVFTYALIEWTVNILLDEKWYSVSNIVQTIIIWKALQLINAPLSTMYNILSCQKIGLMIIIGFLPLRFLSVEIFSSNFDIALLSLTLMTALFYITYTFFIYFRLKHQYQRAA